MSTAINYKTNLSNRNELALEIIRYCLELAKSHEWAVESFDLRTGQTLGQLEGWTKFMPMGADELAAGFRDLCEIVQILHSAATKFNVAWQVNLEGIEGVVDTDGPNKAIADIIENARRMAAADDEVRLLRGKWLPTENKRFSTKGKQALQRRWKEAEAITVLGDLFVRHKLPDLPFGQTDADRADLRGIDLALVSSHFPEIFHTLTSHEIQSGERPPPTMIEKVDISFGHAGTDYRLCEWMSGFHFQDSLFDGVNLGNGSLCGIFSRCSLRGIRVDDAYAKLMDCDLSYSRVERHLVCIERCRFDYANLSGWENTGATVADCSFLNANLNGSQVGETRFIRCNFEGASFDNTSYSDTVFEQCTGLDMERMLLYSCFMCGMKLCKRKDIAIV